MSVAIPIVLACAVCGAAEKALPSSGNEIPFEGRKRATLELRAASFETRDRSLRLVELRAQPGMAMTVGGSTLLSIEVPLLRRSLSLDGASGPPPPSGAPAGAAPGSPSSRGAPGSTSLDTTAMMLGDVELRAAHTPWRSAPGTVTRRFSISAGAKLPTARLERDPAGALVHPDLQPGCGSIVPFVGVTHAWSSSWWSAWTGASLLFPVVIREASHPGDSLRAHFTMQMQPARIFATRLGVHGRYDGTGELDGEVVRRSGGAAVNVSPEIVLSPTSDVVLSAGASFPIVQEMRGYRTTAPVLLASVGVDF